MRWLALGLAALVAAGCSRETSPHSEALQIPTGTEISVEKKDGVTIVGRLVDVQPQEVVLERDGQKTRVPRSEISRIAFAQGSVAPAPAANVPAPAAPRGAANASPQAPSGPRIVTEPPAAKAGTARPVYTEVTIPAGTTLPVELRTSVGSASSNVEDQVRGTIARPVVVGGVEAIPAGAVVLGTVTEATRSGRVKGRARVAFRFTRLDLPGDTERITIRTGTVAREAAGTEKKDAAKIGGAAAAGAVIGGIVGGGDGAAKGAAIGGGAGTAAVLSTRGAEITVPAGTTVSVRLAEAITLNVRQR